MDQKTVDMMEKIMDTERMGYAYVYPSGGGAREEYLIATTPENMAGFIAGHHDAQRVTVTDIADRPLLDVSGGTISGSPGPGVRTKVITCLAQIQAGEKKAGEILQLDRREADAYFAAEDRAAAMAEYGMECGMG